MAMMNGLVTTRNVRAAVATLRRELLETPPANMATARNTIPNGNITAFAKYAAPSTTPSTANVRRVTTLLRILRTRPDARYRKAAAHISGVTNANPIRSSDEDTNRL